MTHTILYLGRLGLNFKRLHDDKRNFRILRPDNKGLLTVDRPSEKVNGIVFGYMENSQQGLDDEHRFSAVRVQDIVLKKPIQLVPRLHTDNKRFGPIASHFEDRSAKKLLSDIIAENPEQKGELIEIYNRYFGVDLEFSLPEEITDTDTLYEGAMCQIAVNAYERSPEARRKCIAHYGTCCAACGLNFAEKYGEIGDGFIHVHHLRELSEIGEKYEVDPTHDLCPVCPNCHVIIHKRKPPYSIEEIKEFLRQAAQ